jgi:hypothetical protein
MTHLTFTATETPQREDLALGRLRRTQSSIRKSLSELASYITRLESALLATREKLWIRTGVA